MIGILCGLIAGFLLGVVVAVQGGSINKQVTELIIECQQSLPRDKNCHVEMKAVVND